MVRSAIESSDFVAYDCETTGLNLADRIIGFSVCANEDEAFYVILEKWAPWVGLKSMPYLEEAIQIVNLLKTKHLLMHNGTFDCSMAESYFKIRLIDNLHTDTMILAHLLDENRKVGLKELAKSIFKIKSNVEQEEMQKSVLDNGGKLTKTCYEMYKADPYIMGKYGAKDAWLTYKLFLELVPQLEEQGLFDFFYVDESMPLLKGPTYQMNNAGLKVDIDGLAKLKKTLEAECEEAKSFITAETSKFVKEKYPGAKKSNTFNMGSSKQLAWLLFGVLKLEFVTLTDSGREVCRALGIGKLPYSISEKRIFIDTCLAKLGQEYQPPYLVNGKRRAAKTIKAPWNYIKCDKAVLNKLSYRHKWIQRLLEYQKNKKLLTTYVEGIEKRAQYGVIRPSFLQHGTTSGRYSSRNPNFQNLPRDDKRIKSCIVARPGKVFVGADYSQLEPRVFAYFSGDERLLNSFSGATDFYSVIGMEVYEKYDCTPQKEGSPDAFGIKYKDLRNKSKVIALASTYGATAKQLSSTTGKSVDDTQLDIDRYFESFPGVKNMMLESHNTAKNTGKVNNLFGRPRRMPEAMEIVKIYGDAQHKDLPYEARNILNLACNHTIQSTAASIVNRAAITFYNNSRLAKINCNILMQVHDSIVVECNDYDADSVCILLQDAMETTTRLKGVSLEAIPKIGRTLADV